MTPSDFWITSSFRNSNAKKKPMTTAGTTSAEMIRRAHTPGPPIDDDRRLYREAVALFDAWWAESGPAPIRLLGVGLANLVSASESDRPGPGLDEVADRVRARFGGDALKPGALVEPDPEEDA